MTRPLHLEFAGVPYHVTSRGDGQEAIYRADGDQRMFLDELLTSVYFDDPEINTQVRGELKRAQAARLESARRLVFFSAALPAMWG